MTVTVNLGIIEVHKRFREDTKPVEPPPGTFPGRLPSGSSLTPVSGRFSGWRFRLSYRVGGPLAWLADPISPVRLPLISLTETVVVQAAGGCGIREVAAGHLPSPSNLPVIPAVPARVGPPALAPSPTLPVPIVLLRHAARTGLRCWFIGNHTILNRIKGPERFLTGDPCDYRNAEEFPSLNRGSRRNLGV